MKRLLLPVLQRLRPLTAENRKEWHSACYGPDMNEMHANRFWLRIDPENRANRS